MAKFIATCQGNRGEASRLGHHNATAIVASWSGACQTFVYDNEGVIYVRVTLREWHGRGISRLIYDGPINEPAAKIV